MCFACYGESFRVISSFSKRIVSWLHEMIISPNVINSFYIVTSPKAISRGCSFPRTNRFYRIWVKILFLGITSTATQPIGWHFFNNTEPRCVDQWKAHLSLGLGKERNRRESSRNDIPPFKRERLKFRAFFFLFRLH